ncbi:MAG: DUF1844 domain-containing protein [Terriglobales bacterium]
MPNKKNEPEFVVTDRRRFSFEDDETRPREAPIATEEQREQEKAAPRPAPVSEASPEPKPEAEYPAPPRPTDEQRAEGSRGYKQSTDAFDRQLRQELGNQLRGDDFKASFDRIIEPLYVTALVQLGYMGQENQSQRRVDIIGARQTIDTLSLLQDKTRGNLTQPEADMLEDVLYDIRMKYLEITNALARAVQNPPAGAPPDLKK